MDCLGNKLRFYWEMLDFRESSAEYSLKKWAELSPVDWLLQVASEIEEGLDRGLSRK